MAYPFYTSNEPLHISVAVHDFYGQQCVGNVSQPFVEVTAVSPEVRCNMRVPPGRTLGRGMIHTQAHACMHLHSHACGYCTAPQAQNGTCTKA